MRNFYYLSKVFVLLFAIILSGKVYATSEVWLSGSTWIAETDGSRVYSGGSFFDAVNAACWNEGSGTINIWSSGNSGPGGSDIYAIWPQSNQTLDFHGNTIHCNGNDLVVAIRADRKSNITVRDVNVTGWPRYGFWFTGCSNVTFTDITMDISSGLGIRYSGRDSYASNLTINGNIDIHSVGHAIETYTVDGIDMGTVTVRSNSGCGVLLNDSENATIDAIYAYDCNYGGSYAGFRQANSNGKTWVGFLYARRCGRGFYSVSGSNNCTVDRVDIADCSTSGASVSNSSHDVYINNGTITNSNKNVDIWNDAWNVCIKVNGSSYGDNCSTGGSYSTMTNRSSGKCVDVAGWSTSNNANVQQWDCHGGENQQFELVDAGSGYYYIKARHSGKCLRAVDGNIVQYDCNNGWWSEMFERISAGSGYYTVKNRSTGSCLRVENSSGSDGASIVLASCNTDWWSQQFSFSGAGSRTAEGVAPEILEELTSDVQVYPNPSVDGDFMLEIPETWTDSKLAIFDQSGKELFTRQLEESGTMEIRSGLKAGMYLVNISGNGATVNRKLVVR